MTGIEYKTLITQKQHFEAELNALGQDSWELVNFIDISTAAVMAALKRQIAPTPEELAILNRPFMGGV